ncbi:sporulation transcriptional regulator SpoIIID [Carboxydothermus pertinax]|uniref:Stage III sporulation protein D n=1 Tax=Carboxydothermus pertinax TaxID=870242 RepID=A0A1L8CTR3_9THEO|nr:sporulation transcriptional regulator SpoIIID [Carboxydothermus pertinax]GAV22219.1 stage III sporulation protein D [Carboxydothermus pertinax]
MQEYILKRVLKLTYYVLENKTTVRKTAEVFGISKSTVHKDLTERLPALDKKLAREIKKILDQNKAERHIRGGEATRQKYKNIAK